MLAGPHWLTLEVKDIDRLAVFYEAFLELDVVAETDEQAVLSAGNTELRLQAPGSVPRGGLHTHYALTIPEREYDDWWERLDERFEPPTLLRRKVENGKLGAVAGEGFYVWENGVPTTGAEPDPDVPTRDSEPDLR